MVKIWLNAMVCETADVCISSCRYQDVIDQAMDLVVVAVAVVIVFETADDALYFVQCNDRSLLVKK